MLRVAGHTILQIANFRITCFSFLCGRISTMALAPNNGHGNGGGNPNRNLLLQLGFENPDPVHEDGMSWARNLHDEALSDVAPGGLSHWEMEANDWKCPDGRPALPRATLPKTLETFLSQ